MRLRSVIITILASSALWGQGRTPTAPAQATAAAPSYGEGRIVPLSTDLAGSLRVNIISGSVTISGVTGTKSNNAGAPGATNLGTLPCIANAAEQSWTEGNQVGCSVDLAGRVRFNMSSWFGATTPTVGQKTMAASLPVAFASDQSAMPVTGTFFQATQPVSGTFFQATQPVSAASLPLPTGATTEATLAELEAKTDKSDNGAAAGANRLPILPGIQQANLPTAGTAGRDAAVLTDLNRVLVASIMPTNFKTFAANKIGLAPAASPTDIAVLPGNATNTVIVTRVEMSCTQTTAGLIDVVLAKRSTADSGGTSAAMPAVPMDSGNTAAVSAPLSYTANPTTGTLVGNLDSKKIGVMATTTTGNDYYLWVPGMGQSIVLRGTTEQIALNLNAVTLTGGSCDITFQWIETTGL